MPHPFALFAKGWDSIHYPSRASLNETSVRARLNRGLRQAGFGLLGWLERFARDERSESRAAPVQGLALDERSEKCRSTHDIDSFLAS